MAKWATPQSIVLLILFFKKLLLCILPPFLEAKPDLSAHLVGLNKSVLKQRQVQNGGTTLWSHNTGHTSCDTGYKKRSRSSEG